MIALKMRNGMQGVKERALRGGRVRKGYFLAKHRYFTDSFLLVFFKSFYSTPLHFLKANIYISGSVLGKKLTFQFSKRL